jgi:hypothetical protein
MVLARNVGDFCGFETGGGKVTIQLRTAVQAVGPQNLIVIEAEDWDYNRSPGTTNVGGAQGRLNENFWSVTRLCPDSRAQATWRRFRTSRPSAATCRRSRRSSPRRASTTASTCPWPALTISGPAAVLANDGGNNSFHMAVDGVSPDEHGRRIGNRINNWGGDAGNVNAFGWVNDANEAPASIPLTAGIHTLSILMREDGMRIDRFLLTTDAAFTLATADAGPAASPRETVPGDTTPPTIVCPSNITVQGTSAAGAAVTWVLITSDNCGVTNRVCTPMNGSVFPVGTTSVHCQATDVAGNQADCSFTVTVTPAGPRNKKRDCLDALIAFRDSVTNQDDGKKLDEAIYKVQKSLNPDYWVDDSHLDVKKGNKVFDNEREAVKKLMDLIKDKKSNIPDATLQAFIDCFKAVDRELAEIAINEAAAAGVKPKKVEKAREELAKGDEEMAQGHHDHAIDHYKHAWEQSARIRVDAMPAPGGGLRLVFYPFDTNTHDVEASSDLATWTKIGSVRANGEGVATFEIPSTSSIRTRFYRVREDLSRTPLNSRTSVRLGARRFLFSHGLPRGRQPSSRSQCGNGISLQLPVNRSAGFQHGTFVELGYLTPCWKPALRSKPVRNFAAQDASNGGS